MDFSDDLRTAAWHDSDTNLLIGGPGETRRVPALDGRVAQATFSPDGRTLAVSRHADYRLPQSQWVDDDTVYLVDIPTLEVTAIPAAGGHWPTELRFSADGTVLQLGPHAQWISLSDHSRHEGTSALPMRAGWGLTPPAGKSGGTCPATLASSGWATDIRISEPGRPPRALVSEVGRRRGLHDYQPDFSSLVFSPSCEHVLYYFDGVDTGLWIVEVATGRTTLLARRADLIAFVKP